MADRFWSRVSGFADRGVLWWTIAGVLAADRSPTHGRARTRLAARRERAHQPDRQAGLRRRAAVARRRADRPAPSEAARHAVVPVGPLGERRGLRRPGSRSSRRASASPSPRSRSASPTRACTPGRTGCRTSSEASRSAPGSPHSAPSSRDRARRASAATPRRPAPTAACPPRPTATASFIVVNRSSGTSVVRTDPVRVLERRLPLAELHLLDDGDDPRTAVRAALARDEPPSHRRRLRRRRLGRRRGARGAGPPGCRSSSCPVARSTTSRARRARHPSTSPSMRCSAARACERMSPSSASPTVPPITVLNTASVGIYPDFVAERERLEGAWGKWLAAVIAAARVLRRSASGDRRRRRSTGPRLDAVRRRRARTSPASPRRCSAGASTAARSTCGSCTPASRVRAVGALAFGRRTSAVLRASRLLPERLESFTTESIDVLVRPPARAAARVRARRRGVDRGARGGIRPHRGPGYRTTVRDRCRRRSTSTGRPRRRATRVRAGGGRSPRR